MLVSRIPNTDLYEGLERESRRIKKLIHDLSLAQARHGIPSNFFSHSAGSGKLLPRPGFCWGVHHGEAASRGMPEVRM